MGNDDRSYLAAGLNQNTLLNKFQIQPPPAMGGSNQLRLFNQCKVSSRQNDDVYGVFLLVAEGPYFAGFHAQFVHL